MHETNLFFAEVLGNDICQLDRKLFKDSYKLRSIYSIKIGIFIIFLRQ